MLDLGKYYFIKPDHTLKNNLMAFGAECGEGWYPLLERTLDKILEYLETLNFPDDFQIVQIKEKWGTLTIYPNYSDEFIDRVLHNARHESANICEFCGMPGTVEKINGWYKTICSKCKIEYEYGFW